MKRKWKMWAVVNANDTVNWWTLADTRKESCDIHGPFMHPERVVPVEVRILKKRRKK